MLRAGGERIGGHDAVSGDAVEVREDTLLVRCDGHLARRTTSNVEHARATLLDVDDVTCGEIDQRGRHGVVGHLEAVREEVRDGRGLRAELECSQPDRRLRRSARDQERGRRGEPARGRRDGGESDNEIRIAEQTGIVSAEADGR